MRRKLTEIECEVIRHLSDCAADEPADRWFTALQLYPGIKARSMHEALIRLAVDGFIRFAGGRGGRPVYRPLEAS